jgi:His-Xaa-Ser system protein HxsD
MQATVLIARTPPAVIRLRQAHADRRGQRKCHRQLCRGRAIKRAAYRFVDRLTIEIEPHADEIICKLRPNAANLSPAALEVEFRNEVLDQDLRIQIGQETEPLRNLILSLAFSKTGLQE